MGLSDSPYLFITSLLTLILILTQTLAQTVPAIPTGPTMAKCGPLLLPMAPCAPFVEGQISRPSLKCCDSLKDIYMKEKDCLCLFINGTALASLPINSTLALQLPRLCSSKIDPSTCFASSSSGSQKGGSVGPSGSQASFKTPSTSTAAAPPVDSAPAPSTVEYGAGKNSAYKLKGSQLGVGVLITLMLAKLL